jgi:hypothetical protein
MGGKVVRLRSLGHRAFHVDDGAARSVAGRFLFRQKPASTHPNFERRRLRMLAAESRLVSSSAWRSAPVSSARSNPEISWWSQ